MTTRRTFLAATCCATALAGKRKSVRLVDTPGEKVAFLYGDQLLFEYQYAKALPKPYVHPIHAANGALVSMAAPPDHLHHRGLMLGWTHIREHDFWSEPKVTAGPHGFTVHQRFERLDARRGMLAAVNHWVAGEQVLLVERRTLRAYEPTAKLVTFDWISEFTTSESEVTIAGAEAGYGALGLRFPRSMDGGDVLNSQGTKTFEKASGEGAQWCAYTGRLEDGGRGGVAMLDHPSNPRHPCPFFVMNKAFGYLNASPTFREPLRVEKGKALRLAYRIVVFTGDADAGVLGAEFGKWARVKV